MYQKRSATAANNLQFPLNMQTAFLSSFTHPSSFTFTKGLTNSKCAIPLPHNGNLTSSRPREHGGHAFTVKSSLVTELAFKAVEVGAATFLSQSIIPSLKNMPYVPPTPTPTPTTTTTPTPSPATMLQSLMSVSMSMRTDSKKWTKLIVCVVMDLVGSGGLGLPFLSDVLDLVTAPLSAVMLYALFGNVSVSLIGLSEELLPGTDGIPSATLAWFAEQNGYLSTTSTSTSAMSQNEFLD